MEDELNHLGFAEVFCHEIFHTESNFKNLASFETIIPWLHEYKNISKIDQVTII